MQIGDRFKESELLKLVLNSTTPATPTTVTPAKTNPNANSLDATPKPASSNSQATKETKKQIDVSEFCGKVTKEPFSSFWNGKDTVTQPAWVKAQLVEISGAERTFLITVEGMVA